MVTSANATVSEARKLAREVKNELLGYGFRIGYDNKFRLKTGETGNEKILFWQEKGILAYICSVSERMTAGSFFFETPIGIYTDRLINQIGDEVNYHVEHGFCHISSGIRLNIFKQLETILAVQVSKNWKIFPSGNLLQMVSDADWQFDACEPEHVSISKLQLSTHELKSVLGLR